MLSQQPLAVLGDADHDVKGRECECVGVRQRVKVQRLQARCGHDARARAVDKDVVKAQVKVDAVLEDELVDCGTLDAPRRAPVSAPPHTLHPLVGVRLLLHPRLGARVQCCKHLERLGPKAVLRLRPRRIGEHDDGVPRLEQRTDNHAALRAVARALGRRVAAVQEHSQAVRRSVQAVNTTITVNTTVHPTELELGGLFQEEAAPRVVRPCQLL